MYLKFVNADFSRGVGRTIPEAGMIPVRNDVHTHVNKGQAWNESRNGN